MGEPRSDPLPPGVAPHRESVLIGLVGLSPAVLTETVWALATANRPVVPDRVVAVTTSRGRERVHTALFAGGGWQALREALGARRPEVSLEGKLRFGPVPEAVRVFPSTGFDGELDDVRSAADNEVAAEFLMEVVRGFAADDGTDLLVSLAGGRKTTGALLHSVMGLLGRERDRVLHVLVDEPWDRLSGFLYPGCPGRFVHPESGAALDSRDARLELAEIPFVPLRYLFERDIRRAAGSYLRLVNQIRKRALNPGGELYLRLDAGDGAAEVCGEQLALSPMEFLFYLYFGRRAAEGAPPVASLADLDDELEALRASLPETAEAGHWVTRARAVDIDCDEDARKWAAGIRKKLRKKGFDAVQIGRLVPHREHLGIRVNPRRVDVINPPPAGQPRASSGT